MVGIIVKWINTLDLTPATRTYLVYLMEPLVKMYLKPCSRPRGEPMDPKIQRVGRGTGNLEATQLESGYGKSSHA